MFSFATSTYPWFRGGFTPLTESKEDMEPFKVIEAIHKGDYLQYDT